MHEILLICNDDFSDKSGSCRVMHESFNNMFDTKMCWTSWLHGGVIICFMGPWVYEILRQMFSGGLIFWVVFSLI